MRSSLFLAAVTAGLAFAADPVPGTPAVVVTNNPKGVTYQAVLPNKNTTTVRGYVAGTSNANGTGVIFNINLYGFPDSRFGPFSRLFPSFEMRVSLFSR